MASSPRLEELDRNFLGTPALEGLEWVDAFDPRLAVRGAGWPQEAYAARSFRRFPERLAKNQTASVQALSEMPAGWFIAFESDSSDLAARFYTKDTYQLPHMPPSGSAGGELYWHDRRNGRWVPVATAVPSLTHHHYEAVLLRDQPPLLREYRLYLPLYRVLEGLEIGIAPGATLRPLPTAEGEQPVVFYGTSITQGGCANTAGSDFVSAIGRTLNVEAINFGFSGNGRGEPEVALALREIDASLFVLDYVANVDAARLGETLPTFLRLLREKHPQTPIVLVGIVAYSRMLLNRVDRVNTAARRDVMMKLYLEAKAAGDEHLYYIDGFDLLPAGSTGHYVDGLHPTSAGFGVMAERLGQHLAMIRVWEEQMAAEG